MSIITMLLLLSILVLVHELGHFGVARMLGIKPERFGFGLPFGPTLYETKWGDTKICIHALLLGGYVAFADDDPDSDIPKDDPSRLSNRKIWERALIISAGVTANAIIAYLLVLFVAACSGGIPSGKFDVFVNGVETGKSLSAESLNLKPGDKILSSNGVSIDSPMKFIEIAQRSKKFDGYVAEDKINEQTSKIIEMNSGLNIKLNPNNLISKGTKVLLPAPTLENPVSIPDTPSVSPTSFTPAGKKLNSYEVKLRNKLEGKKYYISDGKASLNDLAIATSDNVHPVNIVISRNGKNIDLPPAYPNKNGIIGIKLKTDEIIVSVKGPVQAITKSWAYLYRNSYYMVNGLWKIITGQIPLHDLHGIIAITKVGGEIIQKKGMWDGLLLTALISIDLAIVNLLPIPALDGGHLMFLVIEKLRGRPVDEKVQEAFAKYGFMFLMGLMILIIFNDIVAIVTDKL